MKYEVEMWAFRNGAVREVVVPNSECDEAFDLPAPDAVQRINELVFFYGQNDNQPSDTMPSVSVGDVLRTQGGSHFLCCTVGWKRLDQYGYIAYTRMSQAERILHCLKHNS